MSYSYFSQKQSNIFFKSTLCILTAAITGFSVFAVFNSNSNGSDGALNITTPGKTLFDPQVLGIDTNSDNIFNFTTVNVAVGCTLRLSSENLGTRPVIWLASGNVTINGVIDLNGDNGHAFNAIHRASIAGAGGFNGGIGYQSGVCAATAGEGPGGGGPGLGAYSNRNSGTSAGHKNQATLGYTCTGDTCPVPGKAYSNKYLLPLIGGSGGGGSNGAGSYISSGGGAGGGAILIASSGTIQITGRITAKGGANGTFSSTYTNGGGGSGGAIRLVANTITGSGYVDVSGGSGNSNTASQGYIRIEAYTCTMPAGNLYPNGLVATPGLPLIPAEGSLPSIKIVSIDGITIPANPSGTYTAPDVTINKGDSCNILIQGNNIPAGTIVNITLNSENEGSFSFTTPPLAGTLDSSTATVKTKIPPGYSRFNIKASW